MNVAGASLHWLRGAALQLTALALIIAANAIAAPGFLNIFWSDGRFVGSLIDIINRGAPVALLALGMSLVVATRGVDLSVGAVMAISGAAAAAALNAGLPWTAAAGIGLAAGVACGAWNGFLVAVLDIQPIVATLILLVAGRGVAQLITDGRILTFVEPHFAALGSGAMFGVPVPALVALAAAIALIALFRVSALGLFVEAIGVNPRASWLAGVQTRLVLMCVYVASGLCAAMAGLLVTADIRGADANNAGLWLELDAILAAVIGGASLYGGRFSLSLAVVGAYILQTVRTGILRSGVPPEFNLVAMALVVAVLLTLQSPAFAAQWRRITRRRAAA